ncbi:MAG TPA: hypothetical protein VGD91_24610, partial [Trebonia sp.]
MKRTRPGLVQTGAERNDLVGADELEHLANAPGRDDYPDPGSQQLGPAAGAGVLSGRAWLAVLPAELAGQRRVMAGLTERCEAWPLAASLLVGCSLGRGAADALSDIDAALGADAPRGAAGAERVAALEAAVAAALPDLGPLVDVLRHRTGPPDHHARGIFAQFADGTQLDLAVVPAP